MSSITGWRWLSLLAVASVLTTRPCAGGEALSPRATQNVTGAPTERKSSPAKEARIGVPPGEVERARLDTTVTAYDLTMQLEPDQSRLTGLARLTARNDGKVPLDHLALQISSSLQWDGLSQNGEKLQFSQRRIDTDADHTGAAVEAVVRLKSALAPGQSASLTAFYSGTVTRATDRLARLDVPQSSAEKIEWDRIEPDATALRGFGDVLWYPVAAPPVLLGEGAAVANEAARQKLRQQAATARLRVSVAYTGTAPAAVYFCGRRAALVTSPEQPEAAAAEQGAGVATADFPAAPLGFRPLHLFVFSPPPPEAAGDLLEVIHGSEPERQALRASAERVAPLMSEWIGVAPQRKVTVAVQDGESFADGAFVVAPAAALQQETVMAGPLAHAWFHSAQPWLDRGVPELMSVLWLERREGRPAALAQIEEEAHALSLAESTVESSAGEKAGLLEAGDEVDLRNKSVAVLWMLRSLIGDEPLKQTLQRLRLDPALDSDPGGFQRALEQASGKQLGWFFDDWVNHDRGLPDLAITSVSPRVVTGQGARPDGSLVAVEVQNRGGAVAEVPVTVRAGALTASERLRIPAHASASVRVLFQGTPEEVQVNDGSVPEIAESIHVRRLVPST